MPQSRHCLVSSGRPLYLPSAFALACPWPASQYAAVPDRDGSLARVFAFIRGFAQLPADASFSRRQSPAPTSAERPNNTSTPVNSASLNTIPPQVTPTVPPRKLHELSMPEPLPACSWGSVASPTRAADA